MKPKQKIQTKRNLINKYKWETRVNYAVLQLNRAKYYKFKSLHP